MKGRIVVLRRCAACKNLHGPGECALGAEAPPPAGPAPAVQVDRTPPAPEEAPSTPALSSAARRQRAYRERQGDAGREANRNRMRAKRATPAKENP